MNILQKMYRGITRWHEAGHADSYLLLPLLIIIAIGLLTQASVSPGQGFFKHFTYLLCGLPVFLFGYFLPSPFLKKLSWVAYAVALALLLWVAFFSETEVHGAQRWISLGPFSMQPSEPAKIATILALAAWFSFFQPHSLWRIIASGFLIVFVPFVLVLKQPDLGTSMIFVVLFAYMSYWAGARLVQLLIVYSPAIMVLTSAIGLGHSSSLRLGQLSLGGHELDLACSFLGMATTVLLGAYVIWHYRAWQKPWKAILSVLFILLMLFMAFVGRPLAWDSLKPYQQKRLTVFQAPEADARGDGYNIIQSLLAIGGGKVIGQGFRNGQLTQGDYVPEQETDFAFSAFAEEWGFGGTVPLLICFVWICFRLLALMKRVSGSFERLALSGILMLLLSHYFINISMNMALLPVTGLPLPFISYGGTAIWVTLFALGVSQRIYKDVTHKNNSKGRY